MTPVVDAHHHFLDPGRFRYPWLGPGLESLDRRFGPEDLGPELVRAGVDATVLVQTIPSVEESRTFLRIAEQTTWVSGVVGWADLTDPNLAAVIEDLRAQPGGSHLVGFRHQVHDEADPAWLRRSDVDRGLGIIAAEGLSYDLLVRTRELPFALDPVRHHRDLRFVIDHLAKPPIASGDLGAWKRALRPFADQPNVWAKLSGLVTEADWLRWRTADLAEAVDTAVELFGADRLLFGSDWPVCRLAASYGQVIDAVGELTATRSAAERSAIFGGAATRAYPGLAVSDGV